MQLLRRITDSDIIGGTSNFFMDTVSRYGSRGVLIDDRMYIAMMYMSKSNLYKLPGGGLEKGEQAQDAFLREINEETGFGAEVIHSLGCIEEHKIRNNFMQLSYCFIAKAKNSVSNTRLSENEKQLGMVVKWMTIHKALEVMEYSLLECDDYSAKFMIIRDQTILEHAVIALNIRKFKIFTELKR